MMIRLALLAVFALPVLALSPAFADGKLTLTNAVFHEIEVKGPDGKMERVLEPATHVVPGEEVFYVITYRNEGKEPADHVVITNPVPKELEFLSSSAKAAGMTSVVSDVSVNNGKTFGDLSKLTVLNKEGKDRPAKPSDVTQVRWSLTGTIEPGSDGEVSFRARLK